MNDQLIEFDKNMTRVGNPYPWNDGDTFRIRHGSRSYLAFAKRMTPWVRTYMRVAMHQNKIVGTGCAVLRTIVPDWRCPEKAVNAWYVCDLRVDPLHRGKRIPARMFFGKVLPCWWECNRCFGITMETETKSKVVRLASRVRAGPIVMREAGRLVIYALSATDMERVQPILIATRGELYYRSLYGIKDLIMTSTKAPLPLLHVNFYRFDASQAPGIHDENPTTEKPVPGFTHMFCLPKYDALVSFLESKNIRPSSEARVLAYNMPPTDFSFVQTSEI